MEAAGFADRFRLQGLDLNPLRKNHVFGTDRFVIHQGDADHVQTYSLKSIRLQLMKHFLIEKQRGFRIISGGVLRKLENRLWWYRFNRWMGERLPAYYIEVQLITRRKPTRAAMRNN